MLESFGCLGKLLQLRICSAEKIPGVGIVRIDLSDFVERIRGRLRVAAVFVQQAEVVPDMRVFWISFGCVLENFFGFVHLAGVYQGYAFVDGRNRKLWVERRGFGEGFQALLKKLLIHVGLSHIVEAGSFGGFVVGSGGEGAKSQDDASENQQDATEHIRRSKTQAVRFSLEPLSLLSF